MLGVALAVYLGASLVVGWLGRGRAQETRVDYFAAGRRMPWWAAALSMVATTFAVDTPLAITEYVREGGLAANWRWWNMLIGGMVSTVVFAPLWRRTGVITDSEFITLRYGDNRVTRFLRGFRAVYMGLFINLLVMGWVQLAMKTVLEVFLGLEGWSVWAVLGVCTAVTMFYTWWGGLSSVIWTDLLQFGLALTSTTLLMIRVLKAVDLSQVPAWSQVFWPSAAHLGWGVGGMVAFLGVQWWASWYPGAEPGGGGYVLQRMAATPSPKEAQKALALFQVLHYIVRPITWFSVALASLLVLPTLTDHKAAYLLMAQKFLSPHEQIFLLIGLVGAYMSTISTHLNWGASYIANDLGLPERRSLVAGKGFTLGLGVLSLGLVSIMHSIAGAWNLLLETGAGVGFVLLARWFWRRISIWSEFTALIAPLVGYLLFHEGVGWSFPDSYLATVTWTVCLVIGVSFVAGPTPPSLWKQFQAQVRPTFSWWHLGLIGLGVVGGYALLWGLLSAFTAQFSWGSLVVGGLMLIAFFHGVARMG